ncbi:MAG: glycosyltransferase [Nitrososphaerales archaeon]
MLPQTSLEPRQKTTLVQGVAESQKTIPALSIIMPVYNEGDAVVDAIQSAIKRFEGLLSSSFELIVVDDGSTDNTRAALNKVKDERVVVVGYPVNSGKGGAQLFAFRYAKGETVIFADGDMQAFPKDVQHYLDALKNADIAIASKRVPGAHLRASVTRNFLSIGFNSFVHILLSLHMRDTQAGFKVFRRSALEKILPLISVKRYAFDVEILVVATKICNLKVVELPAIVDLPSGFSLRNIIRMMVDLLGIAYRLKIKHWYQDNHGKPHDEYRPILRW